MTSRKLEHLNERVQHKLGLILERETNDPRFRHVTVTGVRLSKDLSHARVTFTTHDALVPAAKPAKPATGAQPAKPRKGPQGPAPKGPTSAAPEGPKSTAPKGLNSAAPGGPKSTAPARPKGAAPKKRKSTGAGDIPSLTKALNGAAGFFSQAVARSLETRISPRLTFVFDPSMDYLQDMENVLKPLRAGGAMGDPNRPTGAEAAGAEAAGAEAMGAEAGVEVVHAPDAGGSAAETDAAQADHAAGAPVAAPHREAP